MAEPTRAVAAARTDKSNFIVVFLSSFCVCDCVDVCNSEQKGTGCKKKAYLPLCLYSLDFVAQPRHASTAANLWTLLHHL